MSNALKFIKNVNNSGTVNNLQLLFQFIMGSKKPMLYDSTKAYKKGDFVYKYDEVKGEYHVYMAIQDVRPNSRGLSESYWQKIALKDLMSTGDLALGKSEDAAKISINEPTEINNTIWFKPLKYKSFGYGNVEKEDITLIFDCEHIVGQDDEPDDPDVRLWFDYEFDHEGNPIYVNSDNEEEDIVVDGGLEILLDDFSDF